MGMKRWDHLGGDTVASTITVDTSATGPPVSIVAGKAGAMSNAVAPSNPQGAL